MPEKERAEGADGKKLQTTKKQFDLFEKTTREYLDKWKVTGWTIYFCHRDEKSSMGESGVASCSVGLTHKCITFTFSKNIEEKDKDIYSDEFIKETAKHEAAHALIGRFSRIATARFITDSEAYEAEEELVNHLTELLP